MEGKEHIPSPQEAMTLEEFRARIIELQLETSDNYLREIMVDDLGETERDLFQKLDAGTLTNEEVIDRQDAGGNESQELFYRYLGAMLSDNTFDKRLEEEQS